jgi:uncharacterized RDD family membrane protein YckC
MEWYYVENGKAVGPMDEGRFAQLIQNGTVTPDSLIWREGMAEWKPRSLAAAELGALGNLPPQPAAAAPGHQNCAQCGKSFPEEDLMKFEGSWVCVDCKPVFLQRLKEGVRMPTAVVYGGFWIRFGAKIIDGILLQIINYLIVLPIFAVMGTHETRVLGVLWFFQIIISLLVPVALTTFFNGKYGATPGKMACRLKIVTADGGKITYLRAFARYFSEIISSMTLLIGYMMAGWDEEKRALHDRICNTRVIRNV